MEILIVVPRYANSLVENYDYLFPLGLSYISAALKRADFSVTGLNLNHQKGTVDDILSQALSKKKYDFVCTGGNAIGYYAIKEIVDSVKKHDSRPKIVLGGPILTTMPKLIFEDLGIDYGVIGEGEETVVELFTCISKKMNLDKVNGIVYNHNGNVTITQARKPIENLNTLPFPDLESLDYKNHLDNVHDNFLRWTSILDSPRVYPILASRSCPFQCTFCYHWGHYRKRSIENVMKEISFAIDKFNINFLLIYDDCFSAEKERIRQFCSEIKNLMKAKNVNLNWFCQLMVSSVDKELLDLMRSAGCRIVSYGFESINSEVLRSMRKAITAEQIEYAFKETVNNKMNVQGTFIFGDPAETKETAEKTLDWWVKNAQGQIRLDFVMPFPGSKIFDDCVKKGIIKDQLQLIRNNFNNYLNITENMSDREISELSLRVWKLLLRHCKHATPRRLKKNPTGSCDLEVRCPFCRKLVQYKNIKWESGYFGLELLCRECFKRYYVASRSQKTSIQVEYYFSGLIGRSQKIFNRFKYLKSLVRA